MSRFTRRSWFRHAAAIAGVPVLGSLAAQTTNRQSLPVAAIVSVYKANSHADVIVGKILEGFDQQGGPGPALKLASLYVDQTPDDDLSRSLATKHGFRIAGTIDGALTFGSDKLQIAGVLSIAEHGDYPSTTDTHQQIYPRRQFFDEIVKCFRRVRKVVPVFNDKHLSYKWADAIHMVEVARAMKIPFLAGSSLPVTWRRPPLTLPIGCEIESALAVGYGPIEAYGFHAMETLQCMVERRAGGERGIAAVRALRRDEIRLAAERGEWSQELFASVLKTMPRKPAADLQALNDTAVFFQLEYRDGLRATIAMANGIAREFGFAAKLRGTPDPVASWFELQDERPFGHFGFLLQAIEDMVHTGKPAYPIERTLLTTGALDASMHSLAEGGVRRATPELDVRYQPVDWPFAKRI